MLFPIRRLAVVAFAATAFALVACASPNSPAPSNSDGVEELNLSIAHPTASATQMLLWVAADAGYFQDENLDVTFRELKSGTTALTSLVANAVDAAAVAIGEVLHAGEQEAEVRAIASLMYGQCCELTLATDVVEALDVDVDAPLEDRIAALEGLTLGASSPGGGSDAALQYLLAEGDLDPQRDATITYLGGGGPVMVSALAAGQVDGVMNNQPGTSTSIDNGEGVLWIDPSVEVEGLSDAVSTVLVTTTAAADANSDAFERLVRAMTRAHELIITDPEAAEEAVRERFAGLDDDVFELMWNATEPKWEQAPGLSPLAIEEAAAFINATGEPVTANFDEVVDMQFLDAVADGN